MKKTMILLLFLIISSCATTKTAEQRPTLNLPIEYKLYFDRAVANKNIDAITSLLTSEREDLEDFRNSYPLARKLYRILTDYSPGEDFAAESRYLPIASIIDVAKGLAIEGGNDLFLKNMPR